MSQSTITEKRTVITSSSSSGGGISGGGISGGGIAGTGYDSLDDIPYKANLGSRSSNIMSRSSLPLRHSGGGGTSIVRTVEYGYGSSMHGGHGIGGVNTGVNNVKSTREKEKKDLQDLNERFANYIEKVRFLEAQNRKLGGELDELRSKWGKETGHIKQMYEAELAEARRLIDDLSKDKAALEIKLSSIQEQNADLHRQLDESKKYRQIDRETINKLNQTIADLESEVNMLRRSIESLETERGRDKATINRLQQEVDKLRIDLNNETLAHLDAENRRQTLEEEMEFMKKVHEQELKELAALAYRDTTAENREFWKNELGQAIRDIQQEYDNKVEQLRGDMEGFYNLKIQEFRTGATKQNMEVTHVREENKKMVKQMSDMRSKFADLEARNAQLEKQYQDVLRELESKETEHMMEVSQFKEEISKLRMEMEGILQELQILMDAKLSLELEICAYRKLLEGEENRPDWRSRASLIMYRDAFRPKSTYEKPETQKLEYEPDVEVEVKVAPVEASVVESDTRDTDAANSVTESDHNEASPTDELKLGEDEPMDSEMNQNAETEEIVENVDANKETEEDSLDEPKSPVEHPVVVKKEVLKIESRSKDQTDGSLTPSPVQQKNVVSDIQNEIDIESEKDQDTVQPDIDNEGIIETTSDEPDSNVKDDIIAEDNVIEPEEHLTLSSTVDNGAIVVEEEVSRDTEDNDQNNDTEEAIVTQTSEDRRDETITIIEAEETENKHVEESVSVTDAFDESNNVPNENEGDIKTHTLADIESSTENTVQDDETPVIEKTEDKVLESVPQTESVEERITQQPAEIEMSPTKELPDFAFVDASVAEPIEDEVMETDQEERKDDIDVDANREDENVESELLLSSDDQTVGQLAESPEHNENPISTEPLETLDSDIQTAEIKTQSETPPPTPEIDNADPLQSESPHIEGEEEEKGMSESISINAKETEHDTSTIQSKEYDIETKPNVVTETTETSIEDVTIAQSATIESETNEGDEHEKNDETKETSIEDVTMAQSATIESETNEGDDHETNDEKGIPDCETTIESGENELPAELTATDPGHEDDSKNTEQELEQTQADSESIALHDGVMVESETVSEQQNLKEEPTSAEEAINGSEHDIQSQDIIAEKETSGEIKLDDTEGNVHLNDTKSEKEEIDHDSDKHEENAESENVDTNSLPQETIIQEESTITQDDVKGVASELDTESKQNGDIETIVEKSDTDHGESESVDQSLSLSHDTIVAEESTVNDSEANLASGDIECSEIALESHISEPDNNIDQTIDSKEDSSEKCDENAISNVDIQQSESETNTIEPITDEHDNSIVVETVIKADIDHPQTQTVEDGEVNEVTHVNGTQTQTVEDGEVNEIPTVNGTHDEHLGTDQIDAPEDERIEQALLSGDDSNVSMKMMRGEVSAKTTYQRTSTGPIAISEVSPEGKFIMLENTSSGPNRKDVNLDGWKLKRTVDGKRDYIYNFRNFTLKAGKKVKILARGHAAEAGLNDLVFREEENWGVGSQVTTTIINDKDEEKASHVQKTNYN